LQHIFALRQVHKTGIKLQEFQRGDDYRILWKRISSSREKFVLLDCSSDILLEVINASIVIGNGVAAILGPSSKTGSGK